MKTPKPQVFWEVARTRGVDGDRFYRVDSIERARRVRDAMTVLYPKSVFKIRQTTREWVD